VSRSLREDARTATAAHATGPRVSAKVAVRRAVIRRLMPRQLSAREIADVVKISVRTVWVDLAALRAETRESLRTQTTLDVAADIVLEGDALRRELFGVIATGNARTKVAAVRAIVAIRDHEVTALQALGVYYRAPAQISIEHEMVERLHGLSPDILARIAAASDEVELRAVLTIAFGEETARRFLSQPGDPVGAEVTADGEVAPG
jgi:hypothetical protein